jgi:hypothetical protein
MRQRALIHVAGPEGAGKTTFIEAILGEADGFILAARCVRDDTLRRSREVSTKTHPELRRYHAAGASGAALFSFPESEIGSDAFFMTDLMEDYSEAAILEGDSPVPFVDLAAFVAPPLPAGKTLLVRREQPARGHRAGAPCSTARARTHASSFSRGLRDAGFASCGCADERGSPLAHRIESDRPGPALAISS